jgi:hypothetical protein
MTHVAQEFGLSDVAVRKICVKHGIPTPPPGYWAKLQHGKKVSRPPLPPLKKGKADTIKLAIKPKEALPADIANAVLLAEQEKTHPDNRVLVPTERPSNLHPVASACEKTLKRAKPNSEGFLAIEGDGVFAVQVGSLSINRSVILRGHEPQRRRDLRL